MTSHTFKFPTKTLASFVSSELVKEGSTVSAPSNGYMEVKGDLSDSQRSLIKDHRGTLVYSTTDTVSEAVQIDEAKLFPRFKKGKKLIEGGHQVTETLNKALEKIEGYMVDGLSKREAYRMWSKTSGLAAELKQSVGHQIGLDEVAPPMKKKEGEKEAPAPAKGGKGIESAAMVALKAKVESDPKSFPKLAAALGIGGDKKGAKKESVEVEGEQLTEAHYRKATENPLHIPAKQAYDMFFKTLKEKKAFFNQVKAEASLEYVFVLSLDPKSRYSKMIKNMGDLIREAEAHYRKTLGIGVKESVELTEAGIKDKIMTMLKTPKVEAMIKKVAASKDHAEKTKKAKEAAHLVFNMLTRAAAVNMVIAHFIEKKKAEELIFEIIMHVSTHASHFSPAHLAHSVASLVMGYEPEGDTIQEVAPPSGPGRKVAHKQSAKIAFTKQYGKEKGEKVRYGRAWNVYKGNA